MAHDDRQEAAEQLAHDIMHSVASKKNVRTDVANMAYLHCAMEAVHETFGEEAGEEFSMMVENFIRRHMGLPEVTPDPTETKFWNLMLDPKLYDKPVGVPKAKKAAR